MYNGGGFYFADSGDLTHSLQSYKQNVIADGVSSHVCKFCFSCVPGSFDFVSGTLVGHH